MTPPVIALPLFALLLSGCGLTDSGAAERDARGRDAGEQDPAPAEEPPPDAPAEPDPTAGLPTGCEEPLACYRNPSRTGAFDAELVPEASGLAASVRNPGVLYLLDDRPGTGGVWLISGTGEHLGTVQVAGLDARNTEDLAVGPCGPGDANTCVYIGDIGDNLARLPGIFIHRFVEPDLSAGPPQGEVGADMITLTYPDQPSDAETLLVDDDGIPYVVTKASYDAEQRVTGPTRLYRAPGWAEGTMEYLGDVPVPEARLGLAASAVGNVITGGDSLDGRVILRTYDHVLEYVAPTPEAPLGDFPTWPVHAAPTPLLPQAEAIAYALDDCGYYTASEQVGDLYFIACRD
ncbi:MAG: hypothetical protein GEU81_01895 [Nitriliruptorales bacterium]|nr:hypothetical protein [Nitriliruptorales bacterium]